MPKPRGPLGQLLSEALTSGEVPDDLVRVPVVEADAEDRAVSLWTLFELHHQGFEDVEDALEWDPGLLSLRGALEHDLLARLRERFVQPSPAGTVTGSIADRLQGYVEGLGEPGLAGFVQREATREQVLDVLRALSLQHLREVDPTAWVVPRIGGQAKAGLVALHYDRHGSGRPERHQARRFARGLAACRLDPAYGAYVDDVPAEVLDLDNALSMFALHRRWRGAALGFQAARDLMMPSTSRGMAQGLRRLRLAEEMAEYFDEDAARGHPAVQRVCAPLVAAEQTLADDVLFGASTWVELERRLARTLMDGWAA